ncbi:right-handed parallel beta-helix repeat-containing protein [Ureibacillus acetophenoni]|uniref:F-box protein 11 n=1 Tax=Ureibacillus acetophenoni TaxID=614649 RepID=A0A285U5M0_9BACL|nr:right-handed parallel beta-helix repeat-containing protein [Ureibacillus acetophenoni]SOC37250.1 F-box protein 11 [Ureibacillus acetophenoni]
MAIMKLFSAFFSNVKTMRRAIQKSRKGEQIKLSPKIYRESIQFDKDVLISANGEEETVMEGIFIIPKSVQVTLQNVTISPTSQIFVEGNLKLENCKLIGVKSEALLSVDEGVVHLENCEFRNAKEVAIALMNHSKAFIKNCIFHSNGKMQLLIQESEAIMEQCELTNAKHGIWLKDGSKLYSEKNHFHQHSGTQIIVDESEFEDFGSVLERGNGNGIYGCNEAEISLSSSTLRFHQLPQIWLEKCTFNGHHCIIQNGKESGIYMTDFTEATITYSEISHHPKENMIISNKSRANIEQCHIHSGDAIGVKLKEEAIANFNETIIKYHKLSQIYVTDKSICSMKQCIIKEGYYIGIFVDKEGSASLVKCELSKHENSAVTIISAQLNLYESEVMDNKGNGILAFEKSSADIEYSRFYDNYMPHIACKTNVIVTMSQSELFNGKSIFAVNKSEVFIFDSKFYNCDQVQIEISDHSTAVFEHCQIFDGGSYGLKITRNSISNFINSQISNHALAQIVVNDSSLIINNSELLEGKRNALLIQNHSEVFIRDSFIAKHLKPQIWIDFESTVDLDGVQMADGHQSDLLAQNRSAIYVSDSIIKNDKYRYNVQAMNYSKIKLEKTIIENKFGEVFYSENNSFITTTLDEVDS